MNLASVGSWPDAALTCTVARLDTAPTDRGESTVMNRKFVAEIRIVLPAKPAPACIKPGAGIQCVEVTLDSGSQAALRPLPGMTE